MLRDTEKHNLGANQRGMASIIVAIAMMLILSLIIIGFSRLIQREQRQTLDRQLSTQAFYAAESGINDAVRAIRAGYSGDKNDCQAGGPAGLSYDIDTVLGVSYTCLLIDSNPDRLEYEPVSRRQATRAHLKAATAVHTIRIGWQTAQGNATFSSQYPNLPESGGLDGDTGVLRMALTPMADPTRRNLIERTQTAYLYPSPGGNTTGDLAYQAPSAGVAQQGSIVAGDCNQSNAGAANVDGKYAYRYCNVDINVSALNQNEFMLQLRSAYEDSNVTITAYSATGAQLDLSGSQAVVDATGRANDVFRRIRVRVPIQADYAYPSFALETADDICKRYSITPNSFRGIDCGEGVVDPPALPPSDNIPQDCKDVNMPGEQFFRFEPWPATEPVGYQLANYNHPPTNHVIESPIQNLGFTLLPGRYDIWLYSWDLHHVDTLQTNERWFANLYTGNRRVFSSDAIEDMPEKSDAPSWPRIHGGMYMVRQVNAGVRINAPVNRINAQMLGPYKPIETKSMSIRAVCASFKRVGN